MVEKSIKPKTLEYCLKIYEVYSESNRNRDFRYLLELDDFEQPAHKRAEQNGFYVIKEKKIPINKLPIKKRLGSQNKPDLFYRNKCPVKGCRPKHGLHRYFSATGLMRHLKQMHPDFKPPDINPLDIRIEAYDL